MKRSKKKKILLDSDVIRHLHKGEITSALVRLYKKRLYLLDIVEQELRKSRHLRNQIEMLLNAKMVIPLEFPANKDMLKEYGRLKREGRGDGESACMAVARFSNDIIASSNLRDIKRYCKDHSIEYLTTMDIIYEAYQKQILTFQECDDAINKIISKGSKLPYTNFRDYLNSLSR